MGRDVLAIDHDDTIQEYMRAFLKYRAETSGIHVPFESLTDYVFWQIVRYGSLEEARRDMRLFVQSPDAALVPALPGAIDALRLLASRYDLVVITSRSRTRTEAPTRAWHDVHTRGLIKEIYFTNQWDASDEEISESKGEAVRRIGAKALIDDSLHHAESCAKIGVPAYLIPRPWNIGKPAPSGVHEPMVWNEIVRAILPE